MENYLNKLETYEPLEALRNSVPKNMREMREIWTIVMNKDILRKILNIL